MVARGLRLDLSYYAWGPALNNPTLAAQAHGYLNGSGLPMKFVSPSGVVLPVYQQVTSLTDEQLLNGSYSQMLPPAQALAVSRQLIDDSQAGGYSAIATQFHVDYYEHEEVGSWVDGTLAYAAARQIPMWTAERWLRYAETRAATTITNLIWTPDTGQLTFGITVPPAAEPQSMTLPQTFAGRAFAGLTVDGQTVTPQTLTVNGQTMQIVQVAGGAARQISARYEPADTRAVSIADGARVEGQAGTSVATLTVSIALPAPDDIAITYSTSNGSATAPSDYQSITSGVVIPAGATSAQAAVTINGDGSFEGDETVIVTLANPIGAVLGDATAILTIVNDDVLPVAIGDTYSTPFATTLNVPAPGVLGNDTGLPPGATAVLVTNVTNGTLALGGNGSVWSHARRRLRRYRQLHVSGQQFGRRQPHGRGDHHREPAHRRAGSTGTARVVDRWQPRHLPLEAAVGRS